MEMCLAGSAYFESIRLLTPTKGITFPTATNSGTLRTIKKCGYVGFPEELSGISTFTIDPGQSFVASAAHTSPISPDQSFVSQCAAVAAAFRLWPARNEAMFSILPISFRFLRLRVRLRNGDREAFSLPAASFAPEDRRRLVRAFDFFATVGITWIIPMATIFQQKNRPLWPIKSYPRIADKRK